MKDGWRQSPIPRGQTLDGGWPKFLRWIAWVNSVISFLSYCVCVDLSNSLREHRRNSAQGRKRGNNFVERGVCNVLDTPPMRPAPAQGGCSSIVVSGRRRARSRRPTTIDDRLEQRRRPAPSSRGVPGEDLVEGAEEAGTPRRRARGLATCTWSARESRADGSPPVPAVNGHRGRRDELLSPGPREEGGRPGRRVRELGIGLRPAATPDGPAVEDVDHGAQVILLLSAANWVMSPVRVSLAVGAEAVGAVVLQQEAGAGGCAEEPESPAAREAGLASRLAIDLRTLGSTGGRRPYPGGDERSANAGRFRQGVMAIEAVVVLGPVTWRSRCRRSTPGPAPQRDCRSG